MIRLLFLSQLVAISATLATASGRADVVTSLSPTTVGEQLAAGKPFIFGMNENVGTLRKQEQYVVRFDTTSRRTIVSALNRRRIADYYNGDFPQTGQILLWGSKFVISEGPGRICLSSLELPNVACAGEIEGPLYPDKLDVPGDLVNIAATQLIQQLTAYLTNPQSVIDRGAKCPRNPNLNQTHFAYRFVAQILLFNGGVLPFITDEAQYAKAAQVLDETATNLISRYNSGSRTTYTDCYGGSDLITPYLVTRALGAYYQLNPRSDVRAYLLKLWRQVVAERAIEADGARNTHYQMEAANVFAAYLNMAAIIESLGERAFQPYTAKGLELLLDNQTKSENGTCTDSKGTWSQRFGGWPHSRTDCAQNLGYHGFIVGALIAMHDYLGRTGGCVASWATTCRKIEVSLKDALIWIDDLADGSTAGALADRAPDTSAILANPEAGTVVGADTAFRLMTALYPLPLYDRQANAVRGRMLQALEHSLRQRLPFSAVASYLVSVSAALRK
jgi:hypothetical protein